MQSLTDLALAPVYAAQALSFLARIERMPEAEGPRQGDAGQGAPLRLLILGDSSAAGVGVTHQSEALPGQMLHHLIKHNRVLWKLVARSGATSAQACAMLRGQGMFDIAVLALGVNDVLRQTRTARFKQAQSALIKDLRMRHGVQHILVSAVPPLGAFEVFPDPLRSFLGRRALALDASLCELCALQAAQHVPFDLAPGPEWLARDGLHPGAALSAEWGKRMAGLALHNLS